MTQDVDVEIKSRIVMTKTAFSTKETLFTSKRDINLRKKLIKCYIWSIKLYGAEAWKRTSESRSEIPGTF